MLRFCDMEVSVSIEGYIVAYSVSDFFRRVEAWLCLREGITCHKYH